MTQQLAHVCTSQAVRNVIVHTRDCTYAQATFRKSGMQALLHLAKLVSEIPSGGVGFKPSCAMWLCTCCIVSICPGASICSVWHLL